MKKFFLLIIILILFFLLNFFNIKGAQIPTVPSNNDESTLKISLTTEKYAPGQEIEGFIKKKFVNENSDKKFIIKIFSKEKEIFKKEKTLMQVLENSSVPYTCKPENCEVIYNFGDPQESKIIPSGTNFLGFKIKGKDVQIQDLSFDIKGSGIGGECEKSPVKIDLTDDNKEEWYYSETGSACNEKFSECYNNSEVEGAILNIRPYCEKFPLRAGKKIEIGAELKLLSGTPKIGDVIFSIYDIKKDEEKKCSPSEISSSDYRKFSCSPEIDYIRDDDYYICVFVDSDAEAKYKIKTESKEPVCGFWGLPSEDEEFSADFSLFVKQYSYAPFYSIVKFNKATYTGEIPLEGYLQNYVNKKYVNCEDGCGIPLKISSNQELTLENLNLEYSTTSGLKSADKFYDVLKKAPNITTDEISLDLKSFEIETPKAYGSYVLEIDFGEEKALADFSIEKVPIIKSLEPTIVMVDSEEEFTVRAYSPKNNSIVSYEWDFGDGSSLTTKTSTTIHTYKEAGKFDLKIKVTDNESLTSIKTFPVYVNITKDYLINIIEKKEKILEEFEKQLSTDPLKEKILQNIDLEGIKDEIYSIKEDLSSAEENEEFNLIKEKVDELKIPKEIKKTSEEEKTLEKLNLDYISEVYKEEIESKSEIANLIEKWQSENLKINIKKYVKTVVYDNELEDDIATILDINVNEKDSFNYTGEFYFMILAPESEINSSLEPETRNGVSLFTLYESDLPLNIKIISNGKKKIKDFIMFAYPNLEFLKSKIEKTKPTIKPKFNWIYVVIGVIVLIFIIGLILLSSHKRPDESKLFKNRRDFINLQIFVANSLRHRASEQNIKSRLEKAGWSKEQIDYVFEEVYKKFKIEPQGGPIIQFKRQKKRKSNKPQKYNTDYKRKF